MTTGKPTGLGIHLSANGVCAAIASEGRVRTIPPFDPGPNYLVWLKLAGGRLACASAPEVIGTESHDHVAGEAIMTVFRRLQEALAPEERKTLHVAIAVPQSLPEPQRRRLVVAASELFVKASLVDSTTATLRAVLGPPRSDDIATVAVVAEDRALEMCVSVPEGGGHGVLAYGRVDELSGQRLNHHLLQTVIDRLPSPIQQRLADADGQTLSKIYQRLLRTLAMLCRTESVSLPLGELATPTPSVPLTAKDVHAWFAERRPLMVEAISNLAKQADRTEVRVVLVGRLGEWPLFLRALESQYGQALIYPIDCIADGAALVAATAPPPEGQVPLPGPLVTVDKLAIGRGYSVHFNQLAHAVERTTEQKLHDFFSEVDHLTSDGQLGRAQQLLSRTMQLTNEALAAMADRQAKEGAAAGLAPPPAEPLREVPRVEAPAAGLNAQARRLFAAAEECLVANRALDAVNLSHQAHSSAPDSHEALMFMLDIHRRGAEMLARRGDFVAARQQLGCALQHRRGDERTRRTLGELLLQQAAYEENLNRDFAEARQLYEEALEYVDNDAVERITTNLQRLQQLIDAHD